MLSFPFKSTQLGLAQIFELNSVMAGEWRVAEKKQTCGDNAKEGEERSESQRRIDHLQTINTFAISWACVE
jgi:hypothetical protein